MSRYECLINDCDRIAARAGHRQFCAVHVLDVSLVARVREHEEPLLVERMTRAGARPTQIATAIAGRWPKQADSK
jgi:hypothetical protein